MQKMGWFGMVRGHSRSTAMSLFDFNRKHESILYRFRDIASYLSKVADFDPPHLHSDTDTDGHRPMASTAGA